MTTTNTSSQFCRLDAARPHFKHRPDTGTTFCGKIYFLRTQLSAYADPVPEGRMSAKERDAVAVRVAISWLKHDTCAHHEISRYFGSLDTCRCWPCSKSKGKTR
jgi:hypothetical protein